MSNVLTRWKQAGRIIALWALLALAPSVLAAPGEVLVNVDTLNVRSGPGLTQPVISSVSKEMVLPVIKEQDNWYQVRLPNGQTGYVAGWLVKPVEAQAATMVQSRVEKLNVRSGPSQTFPVIQTIDPGTAYPLVQKSGQWLQIQLPGGRKGWVADWLADQVPGSSAQQPPASAPAAPVTPTPVTPAPGPASGTTAPVQTNDGMLTVTDAPYVYPEPDDTIPAIGQLAPGQKVRKLDERNGWVQIDYAGIPAWIPTEARPPITMEPDQPAPLPGNSSPGGSVASPGQATATVTATTLNLRGQPSTQAELLGTLPHGTSLAVLQKQGDWYQVKTPSGQTGWVAGWLVEVNEQIQPGESVVTILNPDTNVRSGPGTSHEIIGRVQAGERYAVVKQEEDWFQIRLADGSLGYVAGWLVNATGIPNVVKGSGLTGKVIVVDAGHGGEDNGATGSSFSTLEKTVNLQVAQLLKNKLEAAGAKVIMTRNDDRKLTLQNRVDIAVQHQADIFVSIHHNTHPNSMTNGTIVFYYREGESSKLAQLVQSEIVRTAKYKDLSARFGNYFVLRENPVVAILAEIGFLSNYEDEIRARSAKQQDLAAEGIYKGILRYFASRAE